MIWRSGLGRQILLSMAVVTIISGLTVFTSFYVVVVIFDIFFRSAPILDTDARFDGIDLLTLTSAILSALLVTAFVAIKLTERILSPLNSLAASTRQIAGGNLAARALPGDQSLREIAQLVEDFNAMARKLQDMANNLACWNAAVAHELRTPLTILKGKLQGVADGVLTADEKNIRSLVVQTDGLARLVNDLRVVTLADAGYLELEIAPVDLALEIRKVTDTVEPSLRKAGFSLKLFVQNVIVHADAVRLRQAFLALLSNTERYADPCEIGIYVFLLETTALIRIEDLGPGLPPSFANRAFEPFARADDSCSRIYGGSGLGLSVVRAIAEAHGGKASCWNSSRGGAIFEISLPVVATRSGD